MAEGDLIPPQPIDIKADLNTDDDHDNSSSSSSVFESGLSFLFGSGLSFAFGSSRTRPFLYRPQAILPEGEQPISLQLADPPAELNSLQAHYVWMASIYMADLIYAGEINCHDRTVLELGAGAGLPSIAAGLYGSCRRIVTSDWPDEDILETLKKNFTQNVKNRDVWEVIGFRWGHSPDELLLKPGGLDEGTKFDVILLSDVLWLRDSHDALLDTITDTLCELDGIVYLTAGLHGGQRGPIEHFVARAKDRKFHVQWIREVRCSTGEPRHWDLYQRPLDPNISALDEFGVVSFFSLRLSS